MKYVLLFVLSVATVCFAAVGTTITYDPQPVEPRILAYHYAIYTVDYNKKCYSWYDHTKQMYELSPEGFLQEWDISFSYSTLEQVQLTPVFDIAVLNRVGSQGWRLVGNPMIESKTITYFFVN